jgi:alpha-glucosidase (family GH31 glycosyl hydrolase)
MDAGLALVPDEKYTALNEGLNLNVFIKSGNPDRYKMDETCPIKNLNGSLYGRVWPGYAAFPDWANPNAEAYWID